MNESSAYFPSPPVLCTHFIHDFLTYLYTRLANIYTILLIYRMGCTNCLSRNTLLEDIMRLPCTALVNWEEIVDEISCSNILQRDNIMFAKKLSKNLVALAKEKDANVSSFG